MLLPKRDPLKRDTQVPSRLMPRRLKLLPTPIISKTDTALPKRENPHTLMKDPSRAKLRRLRDEPSARKSRHETPGIFTYCWTPQSETELPKRTKLRKESELPRQRKSSTAMPPPNRDDETTERALPRRDMPRRDK